MLATRIPADKAEAERTARQALRAFLCSSVSQVCLANAPPLASRPLQFFPSTTRVGARTQCLCRARPASISPSTTMSPVSRASSRARQLLVELGTCLSSSGTQAQANESCMPNRCVKTSFLCLVAMQGHQAKPGSDALGRRLTRPRADNPPEEAASSPPHGLGNSQPLKHS